MIEKFICNESTLKLRKKKKKNYLNSNGIVSCDVNMPIGTIITCKLNVLRSFPIKCGLSFIVLNSNSSYGIKLSMFNVGLLFEKYDVQTCTVRTCLISFCTPVIKTPICKIEPKKKKKRKNAVK